MAQKIYITPSELWDYFVKHKEKLKNSMELIAENKDFGVDIFLTESMGFPSILINADDEEIYDESILDKESCADTIEQIYEDYLTDNVISILTGEDEIEHEMEMDEREAELDMLVSEFISGVLSPDEYFDETSEEAAEIIDDCKEHFLEYLARKHGLSTSIYRPMYLEDEDGKDFYEDHPYDCMEFEDEDNPIYQ